MPVLQRPSTKINLWCADLKGDHQIFFKDTSYVGDKGSPLLFCLWSTFRLSDLTASCVVYVHSAWVENRYFPPSNKFDRIDVTGAWIFFSRWFPGNHARPSSLSASLYRTLPLRLNRKIQPREHNHWLHFWDFSLDYQQIKNNLFLSNVWFSFSPFSVPFGFCPTTQLRNLFKKTNYLNPMPRPFWASSPWYFGLID